ncbi:MAG: hypothetical protein R6W73_04640 [Candidatus Saliniplasma sp.]
MEDPDYEEDLKKEKELRRRKMYKKIIVMVLMGSFIGVVTLYESRFYYRLFYYIAGFGYIFFIGYRLMKDFGNYRSLMDDMLLEGNSIIKYNTRVGTEIMRIPINKVDTVYYNIKELPRTLYVVYTEDGYKRAEHFYKTRIKEKEKFIDLMEDREMLKKEPISFDTLKEMIES